MQVIYLTHLLSKGLIYYLIISAQEAPVQDNPEVALPGGPRAHAPPSPAGAVQGGVQAAQQVAAPDAWDDEDEA